MPRAVPLPAPASLPPGSGAAPADSPALTLFDGMVLVAALAPGLTLSRALWAVLPWPWVGNLPEVILAGLSLGLLLAAPFVLGGSLALVGLRLRQAGANLRAVIGEPGTAAGVAVGAGVLLGVLMLAPLALLDPWRTHLLSGRIPWPGGTQLLAWVAVAVPMLGAAVASAWLSLWAGGRWRARPTWTDRAGRLCGAYWLLATPFLGALLLRDLA